MGALATWAMLLALFIFIGWVLWEAARAPHMPSDYDRRTSDERYAEHPAGDCTDPTCCVSAEQSAAMVAAESGVVDEWRWS